jgi:hypothetical protein
LFVDDVFVDACGTEAFFRCCKFLVGDVLRHVCKVLFDLEV